MGLSIIKDVLSVIHQILRELMYVIGGPECVALLPFCFFLTSMLPLYYPKTLVSMVKRQPSGSDHHLGFCYHGNSIFVMKVQ